MPYLLFIEVLLPTCRKYLIKIILPLTIGVNLKDMAEGKN